MLNENTKNVNTEYTITHNDQYNSVEVQFTGKPSEAVRDALKALRFRWHSVKKVWYGYTTEDAARKAIEQAEQPLTIPESSFVDGGGLYDGWKGGNYCKWRSESELKQFILSDLKKAGISASIRFHRGGYLTSFTLTIKISADEIKNFDEWRKDFTVPGSGWISYNDAEGKHQDVFAQNYWYKMTDAERAELLPLICASQYKYRVDNLTSSNSHGGKLDVLTEKGNKKFATVQAIVSSYNKDCSNSMIDYFDRAIYDNYTFKIA